MPGRQRWTVSSASRFSAIRHTTMCRDAAILSRREAQPGPERHTLHVAANEPVNPDRTGEAIVAEHIEAQAADAERADRVAGDSHTAGATHYRDRVLGVELLSDAGEQEGLNHRHRAGHRAESQAQSASKAIPVVKIESRSGCTTKTLLPKRGMGRRVVGR